MPNGGVPLHMMIQPSFGEDYVLYARESAVHIIKHDDWERHKVQARPLLSLTPAEVRVLVAFVQHWSGDKTAEPIYSLPEVHVEYDW